MLILTMLGLRCLIVICLLLPGLSAGADDGVAPKMPPKVGLDEKLGDRVPADLEFTDELGRKVRLGDLVDRPTLLAPVYFRCSNVCNVLQSGLAQTLPRLNEDLKNRIRVISFSFDPRETPALARGSKKIYRAAVKGGFPMDNWSFLTGSREAIARLTDAIGYRFYQDGAEFVHPVAVAVLSPEGRIVRYLEGTRFLPTDLTLSLMEASDGRLGSTISRLASFCYSYDPEQRGYVFNILRVTGIVVTLSAVGLFAVLVFGGRKRRRKP
ncbi:SCO family protein [Geothermobacter hydrogeniphilus]|nr:SCO family protein [Geothermobacter hydrogeniphilus]